nr:reverse transcriptase domain-containing protein [Tanacetum cinerariifolium]
MISQTILKRLSISDDKDDEPTPQPKTQPPKPVRETPIPKPYKPKIPYPQCLRKEKMESQYGKFLDMIRAVRINVPLVDVLAGIPNYGKFLKELVDGFILDVSVFKHITYFEDFVNVFVMIGFDSTIELVSFDKSQVEFVNVFVRIGFDSTIELVSFDKSQVVTFNGKFAVSGMVIAKPRVRATTRSTAHIDKSRLLRWIVSLFEWNSSVSSMKSSIQSTFRVRSGSGNGSTSSELKARVFIQMRTCLDQFARKLYGKF